MRLVRGLRVATATGSLARSQGTTSAGRIGTGEYEVIFNQDVSNCTYLATLGVPTASATAPGEIAVSPRFQNVNGVFVATYNSAGAGADRSFHLVVVC